MKNRNRQIIFRVNSDEELLLKQKCFDLGVSQSEFLRNSIENVYVNLNLNIEISKLSNEIRKIGTNINQIAKVANQTGIINEVYLKNYKYELDMLIIRINNELLTTKKRGR